ncbi:ferredoxin family protein [Streptomyces sp. LHD-70]|uniref:indolepyruvate ferredoxin oxidoreductase subunit alpha n=1 Tax=Streptomyces sp. LHD-70 TaxID=3072140 RepID=UPI00280FAF1E|nr:ferredoxin family protein [Streptomyces sp. LHD-70]MDQ8705977.1 ferredoxin family protein [Streptomyces sp. LHD-70]
MSYVIGEPCIDVMDRSCMEECPVDAIYPGERMMYINPTECIGCGSCALTCPTQAIKPVQKLPDRWKPFREAAADLFAGLGDTPGGSNMAERVPDSPLVDQRVRAGS